MIKSAGDDLTVPNAANRPLGDYEPSESAIKKVDYDLSKPALPSVPRKKFWDTDFGKIIRGKTKVGKIVYGLGAGALAIFTGVNPEPVTDLFSTQNQQTMLDFLGDFNLLSLLLMIIALAFGYLKSRAGNKLDSVYEQAKIGFQMWSDFKSKSSDAGREVSEQEKDQLIEQAGKLFEAIINVVRPEIFGQSKP